MKNLIRDWHDPLVLKLITKHRGRDPQKIVRSHAQRLLEEAGQNRFPIDVEGIASLLGIKRRLGEYAFAGRIFAEPSGQLVMDVTTHDVEPRRRFTCGHEITHTVFPGFTRETRYRVDPTVGAYVRERDEEEFLCDVGAAELLLPSTMIAQDYDISRGLSEVEELAEEAEASLEATANRLVELTDQEVGLVVMEVTHKPADRTRLRKGEAVEPRLRVRYAKSHGLDVYIPRFKSASEGSPFVEALETGDLVRQVGRLPGIDSREYLVEAKRYNRTIAGRTIERVIALFRQA